MTIREYKALICAELFVVKRAACAPVTRQIFCMLPPKRLGCIYSLAPEWLEKAYYILVSLRKMAYASQDIVVNVFHKASYVISGLIFV